ncbi:MAG: hypothetical protein WC728_04595 [Elusimicrobiota bacterium]
MDAQIPPQLAKQEKKERKPLGLLAFFLWLLRSPVLVTIILTALFTFSFLVARDWFKGMLSSGNEPPQEAAATTRPPADSRLAEGELPNPPPARPQPQPLAGLSTEVWSVRPIVPAGQGARDSRVSESGAQSGIGKTGKEEPSSSAQASAQGNVKDGKTPQGSGVQGREAVKDRGGASGSPGVAGNGPFQASAAKPKGAANPDDLHKIRAYTRSWVDRSKSSRKPLKVGVMGALERLKGMEQNMSAARGSLDESQNAWAKKDWDAAGYTDRRLRARANMSYHSRVKEEVAAMPPQDTPDGGPILNSGPITPASEIGPKTPSEMLPAQPSGPGYVLPLGAMLMLGSYRSAQNPPDWLSRMKAYGPFAASGAAAAAGTALMFEGMSFDPEVTSALSALMGKQTPQEQSGPAGVQH